jgi:hypothetical protein
MAVEAPPLFVAEGQPSELDVLSLVEELGPGATRGAQADVAFPFRMPSYISIGEPIVFPVKPMSEMSATTRHQFKVFEFHQVQFACSFDAAAGCRFTDARFAGIAQYR